MLTCRLKRNCTFYNGSSMGSRNWQDAEAANHGTLLLDGSVAKYHASLAKLFSYFAAMTKQSQTYTVATLLDLDSPEYRRLLKEPRPIAPY
jgi:hypothetical protein